MPRMSFFTEFTFFKGVLYSLAALYVICTAIAVICEPYMTLPCTDYDGSGSVDTLTFPNVLYKYNPCYSNTRYLRLMGMTPRECRFGRNLVMATLLGSIIGYERKSADRPAGISEFIVKYISVLAVCGYGMAIFTYFFLKWNAFRNNELSIPSCGSVYCQFNICFHGWTHALGSCTSCE